MSPAMNNAATTLASETESVIGMLCDLLDRETGAVTQADFKAFAAMQNDKIMMFGRYKSLMETLTRQNAMLKEADAAITTRIKILINRFQETVSTNSKALETGRQSMQRITDRIVRTARETVYADRQTYNSKGASGYNTKTPLNLKVNEVL